MQDNDSDGHALVDSGCTQTIMKHKEAFKTYATAMLKVGSAISNTSMNTFGKGIIDLVTRTRDGNTATMTLDALHCPTARHNLLSLGSLLDQDWSASLKKRAGTLKTPDKQQVDLEFDNLYKQWTLHYKQQSFKKLEHQHITATKLWHLRYAHLNCKEIDNGSRLAQGFTPPLENDIVTHCRNCSSDTYDNQRSAHQVQKGSTKGPLALVYIDVAGPVPSEGAGNNRMTMTMMDAYSEMMWTYPI